MDLAAQRGAPMDGTSISHVVSGRWRSKRIEQFIAQALGLSIGELWPEHKTDRRGRGAIMGKESLGLAPSEARENRQKAREREAAGNEAPAIKGVA